MYRTLSLRDHPGSCLRLFVGPCRNNFNRSGLILTLIVLICLSITGCTRQSNPTSRLKIKTQNVTTAVAPGGQVSLDLLVSKADADESDGSYVEAIGYLPGQQPRVIFNDYVFFEEPTNVSFEVPESVFHGEIRLEIAAESGTFTSKITQRITLIPHATIEVVKNVGAIFSGGSERFTIHVHDNVHDEPASFSDVQVFTYFAGERVKEIFSGFTDEEGLVSFDIPVPGRLQGGQVTMDVRAQTFVGEARFNRTIDIKPSVGISLIGNRSNTIALNQPTSQLIHVWDYVNDRPAAGASIAVENGKKKFAEGVTDEDGAFEVRFTPSIPGWEAKSLQLQITAETEHGEAQLHQRYNVVRKSSVLVSTDKPVYQPGQTIHMRALVLDSVSHKPIETDQASLTVRGPRGNTILKEELATSDYGIATFDVELDTQATSGDYTLMVNIKGTTSSRVVEVKPYTLPRFEIAYQSTKAFYRPGKRASGTVDATYFFGKPVAGGQVIIKGFAPISVNSQETKEVFEIKGETDESGRYAYDVTLPDTFRNKLDNSTSQVELEISVIDPADHVERVEEQILLAEQDLIIKAVPESGIMQPGLENLVYIQASYPDGRPAQTTITIEPDLTESDHIESGQSESELDASTKGQFESPVEIETDEFGLATVKLWQDIPSAKRLKQAIAMQRRRNHWIQTDRSLFIRYETMGSRGKALEGSAELRLPVREAALGILMQPESPEIAVGQPLNLDIRVAGPPTLTQNSNVFIEVSKADQTVSVASAQVQDGHAQATIDVDPSLLGTISVRATFIAAGPNAGSASLVSDQRLILINPAPMQIDVEMDQEVYRPGDLAHLTLRTSQDGQVIPSMIGLSIVDESVFALGAQDPGFARTFFLLDRELLKSRYGIDGFSPFGNEYSPYDHYQSHWESRFAATVSSDMPTLAQIESARQTALLGLIAQDLAIIQQAEAAAPHLHMTVMDQTDQVISGSQNPLNSPYVLLLGMPLLGAAIYQRRRTVGQSILLLSIILLSAFIWAACGAPASAPAADSGNAAPANEAPPVQANMADAPQGPDTANDGLVVAKPRLRQYFPETLFWMPQIETGADGQVEIDVPIADSITTWRVSVIASDKEGNLGSAQVGMRVFQDFFVDPQLPRFLSQGDELDVPVSIFNYLEEEQEITLAIADAHWFEVVGDPQLTFTIAANEVSAAEIPLRVTGVGQGDFQITATGSKMSDAILRSVQIEYNAEQKSQVRSGRLKPSRERPVRHQFRLSEETVPGSVNMQVTFYPSIITEVLQGLDGMLTQPAGCFEQTSSKSYPNVLILDYLQTVGLDDQNTQALRTKAQRLSKLGYQRLTGFEIPNYPGGFSLYGAPAPNTMLTAYGLMQFNDMSKVTYVDPALISRMISRLQWEQWPDGSWSGGRMRSYGKWANDADRLVATAYIVWAMADAGVNNNQGYTYILNHPLLQGDLDDVDPYVLAIVANSLAAYIPNASGAPIEDKLFEQLLRSARYDVDTGRHWDTHLTTFMGSRGRVADLETTALVAYGLLRRERDPDAAYQALEYLVNNRDRHGGFYNTQSTVMALKALVLAATQESLVGEATITVTGGNGEVRTLTIGNESDSITTLYSPQHFFFNGLSAEEAKVEIAIDGERTVNYQVVTQSYLPWAAVADAENHSQGQSKDLQVDISYDRTQVLVNELVNVEATLSLEMEHAPGTIMATIGIPPGFTPIQADLDELVAKRKVDFYERSEKEIIFYLSRLNREQELTLPYRLLARIAGKVQTPPSIAYDYYTPEQRDVDAPQEIVVVGGLVDSSSEGIVTTVGK
ncbi:MAG: alpha-2-macroglobulin family protein [Chloroflexota bacterium]